MSNKRHLINKLNKEHQEFLKEIYRNKPKNLLKEYALEFMYQVSFLNFLNQHIEYLSSDKIFIYNQFNYLRTEYSKNEKEIKRILNKSLKEIIDAENIFLLTNVLGKEYLEEYEHLNTEKLTDEAKHIVSILKVEIKQRETYKEDLEEIESIGNVELLENYLSLYSGVSLVEEYITGIILQEQYNIEEINKIAYVYSKLLEEYIYKIDKNNERTEQIHNYLRELSNKVDYLQGTSNLVTQNKNSTRLHSQEEINNTLCELQNIEKILNKEVENLNLIENKIYRYFNESKDIEIEDDINMGDFVDLLRELEDCLGVVLITKICLNICAYNNVVWFYDDFESIDYEEMLEESNKDIYNIEMFTNIFTLYFQNGF